MRNDFGSIIRALLCPCVLSLGRTWSAGRQPRHAHEITDIQGLGMPAVGPSTTTDITTCTYLLASSSPALWEEWKVLGVHGVFVVPRLSLSECDRLASPGLSIHPQNCSPYTRLTGFADFTVVFLLLSHRIVCLPCYVCPSYSLFEEKGCPALGRGGSRPPCLDYVLISVPRSSESSFSAASCTVQTC